MSSAEKPRVPNLTSVEAQRIAERAAQTLVAPLGALAAGSTPTSATTDPKKPETKAAQRLAKRATEALFARDKTKELMGLHILSVRPGGARGGGAGRRD